MITPRGLYDFFQKKGVFFYTGVPDSLLKSFLSYVQEHAAANLHVITASEGLAVGLASGYYLSTNKLPLVYLQNSGLGNIINPLTSLADKEMYAIPMLLLIGWRGQPGNKDEAQHLKMGRITIPLLDALEIPCFQLCEDENKSFREITKAIDYAVKNHTPAALLVAEGLFEKYEGMIEEDIYLLQREEVIKQIIAHLKGDELVVCSTGKIGREFYEQNILAGKKIKKLLLSVGAMGHANHIALGVKMQSSEKMIIMEGDGALLMHLGSLPTIAHYAGDNFVHIVINNGSHESVGGQPTEGFAVDFCALAKSCGYNQTVCITSESELVKWLTDGIHDSISQFVEIRTNKKSRKDLGRPSGTPVQWKNDFMNIFKTTQGF